MKKRTLLSNFFNDDDFFSIEEDDGAESLLASTYGGAAQSSLSVNELMEGLPEYVPEAKKASGADSPSVPATVEERKQRKESFLSESKLFHHLLEHYPVRKYGNMTYIRRGYVWLPVSEDVVGALLLESLPEEKQDAFIKKTAYISWRCNLYISK